MSKILDKEFWENRYKEDDTGWNIGYPSTPLKEYIDQLENKNLNILIPGCGNAYEAEYLHQQGFANVHLLDMAENALINFKNRVPDFPDENLLLKDFFKHDLKYDLILEQTFFCSFYPEQRDAYVRQMHSILEEKGKLVGVLFNREFEGGPPFGGKEEEYIKHFESYFTFNTFELAYNSIEPRRGSELFINLSKKKNGTNG